MRKLILFGASKACEIALDILEEYDIKPEFIVDNNNNKWGTTLENIDIRNPNIIKNIDKKQYMIVVTSMYYDEISKQLKSFGLLEKENFYDFYDFQLELLNNDKKFVEELEISNRVVSNTNVICMVLPNGFILGGIENWTRIVSKLFLDKGFNIEILNMKPMKKELIPKELQVDNCKIRNIDFKENIKNLCIMLVKRPPLIMFDNGSKEIDLVNFFLNKILKQKIKVISILHGDCKYVYCKNIKNKDNVNKFICVSDRIKNNLIKMIPERKKDIYCRYLPIDFIKDKRFYTYEDDAINIGFAGRLTKYEKRSDYLIDLIENLEKKKLRYILNIAGTGEYEGEIRKFINDNLLQKKVILHGVIPYEEMQYFWQKQDVYINVSDSEGMCLAMLEAMGQGCVPVVTNVSGTEFAVENGINGFVSEIGDIIGISNSIEWLINNKEKIKDMGRLNIEKIKKNCSKEEYIEFLINEIL